jgi:hypothetical protein
MPRYETNFEIPVANPSPYERTDYVHIDLDRLGVPPRLNENNLTLYRYCNSKPEKVPYQIDYLVGRSGHLRVMTFLSVKTPSGPDDYSEPKATFLLQEEASEHTPPPENLRIEYYYSRPERGEPDDGFNPRWEPGRSVAGVKLKNSVIEIYVSLVPSRLPGANISYTGAVTSLTHLEAYRAFGTDDFIDPFREDPEKLWGQISEIAFFPLPWKHEWFYRVPLLDQHYELVWANSGPVRAVITIKSSPIIIRYDGTPYFNKTVEVECHLYRVISVYPDRDNSFYTEHLFVETTDTHKSLAFRPYYRSIVPPPFGPTELKRFEHIPDYYVLWKHFALAYRGFGFAADAHVRGVELRGSEIFWRLPISHHNTCVHYFLFHPLLPRSFDPFHAVGHSAWYEKAFKPLAPTNFELRWPPILLPTTTDTGARILTALHK